MYLLLVIIKKKNIFVYYVLVTLLYFSCASNRQNSNISVRGKGSLFDDEESLDKILDRYVENGSLYIFSYDHFMKKKNMLN